MVTMLLNVSNKFTRVSDLIGWGFNAPSYVLVDRYYSPGIRLLDRILDAMDLMEWERVSIRSLSSLGRAKFFYPNLTRRVVIEKLRYYGDYIGDSCMLSEGISFVDHLWSGVVLVDNMDFIFEAVMDSSVRSLTHSKVIPDVRIVSNFESDRWRFHSEFSLVNVIDEVRMIPISSYSVEWSIFPYGVGVKNQSLVFWEYEELDSGFKKCVNRGN